ncbi:hypothetical protein ACFL6U_24300 [Planctomycetota bacterium]
MECAKSSSLETSRIAFARLLEQFRQAHGPDRVRQQSVLNQVMGELTQQWDSHFPDFPPNSVAHASFKGVMSRGIRDTYLKQLIQHTLANTEDDNGDKTIVNPVCVFGRHARDLAAALPSFQVVATDIFSGCNWIYQLLGKHPSSDNYKFFRDNIFNPQVTVKPLAVVFFGACGSLTDAAIDYTIQRQARYLMCRTCCHDNIAGNTHIVRRANTLNRAFRLKNLNYRLAQRLLKGHYFDVGYGPDHYPTSAAARQISTSEEFLTMSRHSVDNDLCRTLIDLDRCLYLTEQGYQVFYRGELLVAIR